MTTQIIITIINFQVIKMLISVVLLFLTCWGPRFILELLLKLQLDIFFTPTAYWIRVTLFILPFVHAVLNPVIYFAMSKNIRANIVRQVAEFVVKLGGDRVADRVSNWGRVGSIVLTCSHDAALDNHVKGGRLNANGSGVKHGGVCATVITQVTIPMDEFKSAHNDQ